MMYFLFIGLFALAFSVGIGLFVTSIMLLKSNDLGNSKGDFKTFSKQPLRLIKKRDRISGNWFTD